MATVSVSELRMSELELKARGFDILREREALNKRAIQLESELNNTLQNLQKLYQIAQQSQQSQQSNEPIISENIESNSNSEPIQRKKKTRIDKTQHTVGSK